ncbi:hypothetical protein B296_00015288 [Ensete ventricosum]|uniref:GST C-terminal domain-containing protein n=1 Tax=Ensete ventricosum TaxID=4639 RepID=A0A427AK01_ENSVE|nr:hypothetical protein B296_00015288 [Ensete ventricosum]
MTSKGDVDDDVGAALDKLEDALLKFDDGPFFLGHFSLVDIAYAPFIERFQTFLKEVKNYDITEGRPKLTLWIEVVPCLWGTLNSLYCDLSSHAKLFMVV